VVVTNFGYFRLKREEFLATIYAGILLAVILAGSAYFLRH